MPPTSGPEPTQPPPLGGAPEGGACPRTTPRSAHRHPKVAPPGRARRHSSGPQGRRPVSAVFDLDGVVTFTARVHRAAWKETFDAYLRAREASLGEPFRAFTEVDYRAYVDGRPRYDGVRTFLESRGIALPEGTSEDPPDAETIAGLGNRKNLLFRSRLAEMGVDVDPEAVRLIRELRARGTRVGVASSSKNTGLVLETSGLGPLFDACVDGVVSERLGLAGKPAPDIFLECLLRLGAADPSRALVAEDAVVGVAAGRAGGFGLVLGVDRDRLAVELREHGADWIVRDLRDVTAERIDTYFRNRRHARPNAIARWAGFVAELHGRKPVLLDPDAARALEALEREGPGACPVFLGSTEADEAVFRALEGRGIGVLVTELPRPTAARYSLQDRAEVRAFLDRLDALRGRGDAARGG